MNYLNADEMYLVVTQPQCRLHCWAFSFPTKFVMSASWVNKEEGMICLIGLRKAQSLEVRFPGNRRILICHHSFNSYAELLRLLYFICSLHYGNLLCLENKNIILPLSNAIGMDP